VSFVRPRELVSLDPWQTENGYELGGITKTFVLHACACAYACVVCVLTTVMFVLVFMLQ